MAHSSSGTGSSTVYTYTASSSKSLYITLCLFANVALSTSNYISIEVNGTEIARLEGSSTASADNNSLIQKISVASGDVINFKYVQVVTSRIVYALSILRF